MRVGAGTAVRRILRAAAAIAAAGALAAHGAEKMRVAAAISLKEPLARAARAFEAQHSGVEVVLNLESSAVLARQILNGAPCDVFLSADEPNVRRCIEAGRVSKDAAHAFLSNELVLIVARDNAVEVRTAGELLAAPLQRTAICDEATPLGAYVRQYLRAKGVLDSFAAPGVRVENARAAVAAVEAGAAASAFVYRTDAAAARNCRVAYVPPPEDQPSIRYWIAPVGEKRAPIADEFVQYLRGPGGAAFRDAGFGVISEAAASRPVATQAAPTAGGSPTSRPASQPARE